MKTFSVGVSAVIPAPRSLLATGEGYVLTEATTVVFTPDDGEVARIATEFAADLRRWTGLAVPVTVPAAATGATGIRIELLPELGLAREGYTLDAAPGGVILRASTAEGLFRGSQTLRQICTDSAIPGVRIADEPRFAWRGTMLDVARHFFSVDDVKRYIDEIAYYKLNVLHLHLSDDQGWRVEIAARPRLAEVGGACEVGGGPGGFYTREEYADLVAHATARYLTVVPEIDMPGHTNAALVAYPEIAPEGYLTEHFTGTEVGFSNFDVANPATDEFVDAVIGELAAMTPGPYLHIGGDEVMKLTPEEFGGFVRRTIATVERHGKVAIGWDEVARAGAPSSTVVQFWRTHPDQDFLAPIREAAARGSKIVMSPGSRTYLDMKYDESTELGQDWAGLISVRHAYEWDPAELLGEVPDGALLGVEAPLWTETVTTLAEIEFMAFPRLTGIAEVGWSAASSRDWDGYRTRLAAHEARWDALGISHGAV
ncbi:hexosaminidase [Allocatelliglobosispora scoriae]|uniref:beta-N-acetylhexosaminidase n=1 Tax=Allocatelliglobosispora scoriae TaxID=643052 RepID=A0A841C020_9ACTN|nr:beta-N-acetylhexosaminidase [Allocatelliglobosispora scoriae]MBB5872493.1 hexosaminidase [Allocatelliglobosispora scoriae]